MLRQAIRYGRPKAVGAGLLHGLSRTAVCTPILSARTLHAASDRPTKDHQGPITPRAKAIPMARDDPIRNYMPPTLKAFCAAALNSKVSQKDLEGEYRAFSNQLVMSRKSKVKTALDVNTQVTLAMQACLQLPVPIEHSINLDSGFDSSRSSSSHTPYSWEIAKRIYIKLTPLLPKGPQAIHALLYVIACLPDGQASDRDHLARFQDLLRRFPQFIHSINLWTVLLYCSREDSPLPWMSKTVWHYLNQLKVQPNPDTVERLFKSFGDQGKGREVVDLAHSPLVRDLLFPVDSADAGVLREYLSGLDTAGLLQHPDVPEVVAELYRRMVSMVTNSKRRIDLLDVLITHVGLTQSAEAAILYAEECLRYHDIQSTGSTVNRLILLLIEESSRKGQDITAKQAMDAVKSIESKLRIPLTDRQLFKLFLAVMGKWETRTQIDANGNTTEAVASNQYFWVPTEACGNETVLFYSFLVERGYRPTPLVLLYMMVIAMEQTTQAKWEGDIETIKMLFAQYRESAAGRTIPFEVADRLMSLALHMEQWDFAEDVIRYQPHLDQWTMLIDLGRRKFVDHQSAMDAYLARRREASKTSHFMMHRYRYNLQLVHGLVDFKPQRKLQPMPVTVMATLLKSLRADGLLDTRQFVVLVDQHGKMASKVDHDGRALEAVREIIKLIHQVFNEMNLPKLERRRVMTTLMDAYGRCRLYHDAVDIFNAMLAQDMQPEEATIAVAFDVCGYGHRLDDARRIQTWLERHPNRDHLCSKNTWDAWLECLCRCGAIREAMHVAFFIMPAALERQWQNRRGSKRSAQPSAVERQAKTKAWSLPQRRLTLNENRVSSHLMPLSSEGLSQRRPDRMTFLVLMSFARLNQEGNSREARDPAIVTDLTRDIQRYFPDVWPFLTKYLSKGASGLS